MLYTVKVFDSGANLVLRGGVIPFETFKTGDFNGAKVYASEVTNEDGGFTVIIVNNETGNRLVYSAGVQIKTI